MQTWFSNSKCKKTQQLGFALHIKISDEEGDSASKTKNKKNRFFPFNTQDPHYLK